MKSNKSISHEWSWASSKVCICDKRNKIRFFCFSDPASASAIFEIKASVASPGFNLGTGGYQGDASFILLCEELERVLIRFSIIWKKPVHLTSKQFNAYPLWILWWRMNIFLQDNLTGWFLILKGPQSCLSQYSRLLDCEHVTLVWANHWALISWLRGTWFSLLTKLWAQY